MRPLSSMRALLKVVFLRLPIEREMEEELHSHLVSLADDLERQRLTRAEEERQARIEFGGYERYKEECREALGSRLLGEVLADVRYGLRQLRRSPGSVAMAVATLGLGIGATTVVFSLVDAVLLRGTPYRTRGDVLGMVVREGALLALMGVGAGIPAALLLERLLSSLLYGVRPGDPLTFIPASLFLAAVALVACYLPARRATRVDTMAALRHEWT